jgi:hypothetical protein
VAERDGVVLHLEGEHEAVEGGVALRLELFGSRLALATSDAGVRLATHLELAAGTAPR